MSRPRTAASTTPHIITLLYRGGNIIASKKTSYADIVKMGNLNQVVEELMKEQHKDMLRRLKSAEFDARLGLEGFVRRRRLRLLSTAARLRRRRLRCCRRFRRHRRWRSRQRVSPRYPHRNTLRRKNRVLMILFLIFF